MKTGFYFETGLLILVVGLVIYAVSPSIPAYGLRVRIASKTESNVRPIGLSSALGLHRRSEAIFIDVRSENEYKQGHISTSLNAPDNAALERLSAIPELSRKVPVLYCGSSRCPYALAAAERIKGSFREVFVYTGGWDEWSALELPIARN
jgi:rhodanese-related sulfurtransferase